ncbi:MAG: fluoride efflux transporter FluC [Pseudomonadota bacterium]
MEPALLVSVALGGAVGGMGRFAMASWVDRRLGDGLPWGTLAVNVTGCFALGWLVTILDQGDPLALTFFATGVLGSFTTVSAVALQVEVLREERAWLRLGAYLAMTLVLGLGAVATGFALGMR